MARSREVVYLNDFTGGLNLTSQLQSLQQSESPDCLNVDFGYRGGFVTRGGFRTQVYNTNLSGARFLGASYYASDVVLIASATGGLFTWNGSALTDTTEDLTDTTIAANPLRMANFNSASYIANGRSGGNIIMQKWDGTTRTTLTNTFNDDYTSPNQGDMPLARHVASHQGYMWVADTVESATRYPHRVRFSHLQEPEDWATLDFFDVDPEDDGDPITAIVPFRDRLMVFKKSSVYAVFGYSRNDFFREKLTGAAGVNAPEAITQNSGVMYWVDASGQIMAYNGQGVVPLTDKLRWWFDVGMIDSSGNNQLMWADGRLFMSLEAGATAPNSQLYWTFVYDPSIKSLTRYDKQITSMFHWERLDQEHDPLFLFERVNDVEDYNLFRFDRAWSTDSGSPDTIDDELGLPLLDPDGMSLLDEDVTSSSTDPIRAFYRTSWITAGETATKKRWKRPRVTAASEGDTTVTLSVYHDFDDEVQIKTSSIVIDADDAALWGTFLWGDTWGVGSDNYYEFSRQPSSGSAYSVQYMFKSTDNPGRWWVDSIAVPFRRKEVR